MTRPESPYGPDNNPAFHGYDQYPATGANAPQPSVLSHSVNAMKFHGKRLIDDTFGDGRTAHPINAPERNGWIHMKGTGKLNIGEALTWGVNTTFSRWKFWIPCGLGMLLALLVGAIPFVGGASHIRLVRALALLGAEADAGVQERDTRGGHIHLLDDTRHVCAYRDHVAWRPRAVRHSY